MMASGGLTGFVSVFLPVQRVAPKRQTINAHGLQLQGLFESLSSGQWARLTVLKVIGWPIFRLP